VAAGIRDLEAVVLGRLLADLHGQEHAPALGVEDSGSALVEGEGRRDQILALA
jgi:hypothetical protein